LPEDERDTTDTKETPEPVEPTEPTEPVEPLQPIETDPAWGTDLGPEVLLEVDLETEYRTKDQREREGR
jgi:hypothetical protein